MLSLRHVTQPPKPSPTYIPVYSFKNLRKLGEIDHRMIRKRLSSHKKSSQGRHSELRKKFLAIDFSKKTNDFNEESLQKLVAKLRESLQLERVRLNFTICEILTDQKFRRIHDALVRIVSLKRLALKITSCDNLTPLSFKQTAFTIAQLRMLKELELCWSSKILTDEHFQNLYPALESLKKLEHLSLSFDDCRNFTDSTSIILSRGLLSIKSLNSLAISLGGLLIFASINRQMLISNRQFSENSIK
eukprot:TRINITY_DN3331_c0_g1_i10.p1 TRINITY_DN3331_c0_g1~~TRINITY_DN3331_c0_g1_i10.p1  ORF type:complete len:246 (+),score=-2.66 TRINITY_DN3331_c0_g1_i10:3-740(+)